MWDRLAKALERAEELWEAGRRVLEEKLERLQGVFDKVPKEVAASVAIMTGAALGGMATYQLTMHPEKLEGLEKVIERVSTDWANAARSVAQDYREAARETVRITLDIPREAAERFAQAAETARAFFEESKTRVQLSLENLDWGKLGESMDKTAWQNFLEKLEEKREKEEPKPSAEPFPW